jgi:hypothetical protein
LKLSRPTAVAAGRCIFGSTHGLKPDTLSPDYGARLDENEVTTLADYHRAIRGTTNNTSLRCAHDDVASGKQEGYGADKFRSFLLQRRQNMETLLIVLVVLFLIGGGGWGYSRWRG